MRVRIIAAVVGGLFTAVLAVPALLLARRLYWQGFTPEHDRRKRGKLDLQVTAISDETVTLRTATKSPSIGAQAPGQYLLQGARGWNFAGRVIDSNGIIAIRETSHGGGDIRAGDYVRLDSYAFPGDPLQAHGIGFEDVRFASPLGEFPAWYVPGTTSTWAIMTHGKGAERRETLRMMPALVDSGFHCLAITYRNDDGEAAAPRASYSYGRDEWEELDGAVAYALAHGASDVVLVGYSMGGAITLSFMANSPLAPSVSALILDSPMTHLEATVAHGARAAGLPVRFLAVSNRAAARIYRFRWSDFDYLRTAPSLSVPILLFHGEDDTVIPVELSDRMAELRPDIIHYVRVPAADHVRAWNVDPEAYLRTVRDFVRTRRVVGA
jgi:hypothetical protein